MVAMRLVCLLAVLALFTGRPAMASISSAMIVEMREIMSASVSPTGLLAVVGTCHSNPRTNKRELSWVIVPLREGGRQTTVPAGEEIFDPNAPGALLTRPALWSRDGRWFFYLRRDGEEVQLWETRADGRMTRQITHSTSDLVDLKRSSDPDKFIVQLAPDRAALRRAEEDENHSGILLDDHVIVGLPLTKTLPVIDRWRNLRRADSGELVLPGWSGRTSDVFDVRLRKLKAGAGTMPTAFAGSEIGPNRVTVVAVGPIPEDPYDDGYGGQYTLQLEPKAAGNPIQKCAIAECIANRITVIGWSPDGAEVYYLADSIQGPMGSRLSGGAAIYAWNPGRNVVRLIHDSGSQGLWGRLYNLLGAGGLSLEPSLLAGREIVTAFAGVDQPPRLEAVNLDTGVARILFDPNAELRSLTQGRAVTHTWETSTGYSGRGIMILPDDYRSGEKYPAVITTYSCRDGFLRGGGADNAPEFVLAHQGFIAICVDVQVHEILTHETDQGRIYPIYCDIVSGLIADLTRDGKLDPARVGLTGQSLGANAGAYCISHSNAIAAAAFRHGSFPEPLRWELSAAWQRGPKGVFGRLQLPDPRNDPTGRWDQLSVSRRAGEINTPTLIQTDVAGGYLGALTLWSAMRDEGKAIEMHVFPEDAHQLIQPVHMLVNYERQMDWFRFWLLREEDAAPSKRDQYDRWNRLRELTRDSRPQH
jgi:dipeptidyl aminopeptidase/acylaminoacyl peptidase